MFAIDKLSFWGAILVLQFILLSCVHPSKTPQSMSSMEGRFNVLRLARTNTDALPILRLHIIDAQDSTEMIGFVTLNGETISKPQEAAYHVEVKPGIFEMRATMVSYKTAVLDRIHINQGDSIIIEVALETDKGTFQQY